MKTKKLLKLNIEIINADINIEEPIVISNSESINMQAAQDNISMIDNYKIQRVVLDDLINQAMNME